MNPTIVDFEIHITKLVRHVKGKTSVQTLPATNRLRFSREKTPISKFNPPKKRRKKKKSVMHGNTCILHCKYRAPCIQYKQSSG